MLPNRDKWFQDEHAKLRKQIDQLDKAVVKHEERLVKLEAGSLKAVVSAIKDGVSALVKAIENVTGGNEAAIQKRIDEITARVLANSDKINDAQERPHTMFSKYERKENEHMALNLQPLIDAVTVETTDLDSFVVFVAELKKQLADALANEPAAQAKVDAVLANVLANKQKIVDAMAANVPV